ncbi:hypothetical protein M501DRAFT_1049951 [Patellaria atrata CBS 101060]|uniref:Uncharacterized protein n=1 Tax=Patellaria atrata CBS 101060 TaxID=1346257 RepID=A0A9P4SBS3_9PEZI|nr:hypothetical protein M501DRAFT_1049951 [Patellaria atrata CBS 101060]
MSTQPTPDNFTYQLTPIEYLRTRVAYGLSLNPPALASILILLVRKGTIERIIGKICHNGVPLPGEIQLLIVERWLQDNFPSIQKYVNSRPDLVEYRPFHWSVQTPPPELVVRIDEKLRDLCYGYGIRFATFSHLLIEPKGIPIKVPRKRFFLIFGHHANVVICDHEKAEYLRSLHRTLGKETSAMPRKRYGPWNREAHEQTDEFALEIRYNDQLGHLTPIEVQKMHYDIERSRDVSVSRFRKFPAMREYVPNLTEDETNKWVRRYRSTPFNHLSLYAGIQIPKAFKYRIEVDNLPGEWKFKYQSAPKMPPVVNQYEPSFLVITEILRQGCYQENELRVLAIADPFWAPPPWVQFLMASKRV